MASPPTIAPLLIWTLSDGRAGIHNQVVGLAEALSRLVPCALVHKKISYKKTFDRLPSLIKTASSLMLSSDSDPIEPPWPDIIIAAGRATLPSMRLLSKSVRAQTLLVQVQNPRADLQQFDLIIAPAHDALKAAHCVSIIGSPHRVTLDVIRTAYENKQAQWDHLPRPHIAILIGGRSKSHDLDEFTAKNLAFSIKTAVKEAGGSLFLTMSRRTPAKARQVLIDCLSDMPGIIYDNRGENPYMAFLGTADIIAVSEDSVNMITEAAATGKPIFRLNLKPRPLRWAQKKFAHLYESLEENGILRPFEGRFYSYDYPPLQETEKAAQALLEAFVVKFPNRALF